MGVSLVDVSLLSVVICFLCILLICYYSTVTPVEVKEYIYLDKQKDISILMDMWNNDKTTNVQAAAVTDEVPNVLAFYLNRYNTVPESERTNADKLAYSISEETKKEQANMPAYRSYIDANVSHNQKISWISTIGVLSFVSAVGCGLMNLKKK